MTDDFVLALDGGDIAGALRIAKAALTAPDAEARNAALRQFVQVGEKLLSSGQAKPAADIFRQACITAPDAAPLRFRHGVALRQCGAMTQAAVELGRALTLQPHFPQAAIELVGLLELHGQFEEAVAVARNALAARPSDQRRRTTVRELVGVSVPDAAIDRWTEFARAHDESEIDLRGRMSHVLLRGGQWTEAWPYYADRRIIAPHTVPSMSLPEWNGRIAENYGVLLRAEQGLGDTIMFARFASLVGAMGANVLLMVPRRLVRLFSNLPHVIEVLPNEKSVEAKNLEWRLLMDLPGLFGITPDTIPFPCGYVTAQPDLVERWRELIPKAGINVGIAWQGNPKNQNDAQRSLPLAALEPLAGIDGVNLVALQIGDGLEQIGSVPFGARIIRPGDDFDAGPDAFLDSAALLMNLDLVVCCDSAIGHLAGALGRPTYLALSAVADWRWLGAGETTGWYPSMRLFRQRTLGDWAPVMRDIADAVSDYAKDRRDKRRREQERKSD